MSSIIYWFSGTGNSYYIARELAKLTKAQLVKIDIDLVSEPIQVEHDVVGLIFPVYHQGLPNIIVQFIDQIQLSPEAYVYSIISYGDKPTLALRYLETLLGDKDIQLAYSDGILMPYNYIKPTKIGKGFFNGFAMSHQSDHEISDMLSQTNNRIKQIGQAVMACRQQAPLVSDVLIESLVDRLGLRNSLQKYMWLKAMGYTGNHVSTFKEALKRMDTGFRVEEQCISCGRCKQVCPVNNIELVDNKPNFLHNCEQCFACIGWCPTKAIMPSAIKYQQPYSNPNVTFLEVIDHE